MTIPIWCATVVAITSLGTRGYGQTSSAPTWEYSPYDVRIWIAYAPVAALTPPPLDQRQALAERAELVVGPSWRVRAETCPRRLQMTVVGHIQHVTLEDVAQSDEDAFQGDKLFLVGINRDPSGYRVQVRELCCRTRTFGPVVTRRTYQREMLVPEALQALLDAFGQLVRIDDVHGSTARVRLRAAGLIMRPDAPTSVAPDAVFQPVLRRDDRFGQPLDGGIQIVPWTFLEGQSLGDREIHCKVHSAMRNPLGGRTSLRMQRIGLRVRPTGTTTELQLLSQDDPPQPLAGYEILAKDSLAEQSGEPGASQARAEAADVALLGRTDWRGVITVPLREDAPLRVLYVKSGNSLLARLPIVPGLQERQIVQLRNDEQRLQAEAILAGFRNQLMDLVARRQVLAAQIRLRIEERDLAGARKLVDQLRELDVHLEMQRLLNQQQQRFSSMDPRTQSRIDSMFAETYRLMDKYLNNNLTSQLTRELAQAEKSG